jgi:hypothetical protein
MVKDKMKLIFGADDEQTKISNYTFTTSAAVLGGGNYVQ